MVAPFSAVGTRGSAIGIGPFFRLLLARLRAWFARQAVLAELSELDQRTLADLRITQGDFHAIAAGTFKREPPWEQAPMAIDLAKVARFPVERPYY
jgi:uncharacterized protein YjiS (DUF1127 family)